MKKITITVDDATLQHLELLRYYYPYSNNSALIRVAIDRFDDYTRSLDGYDDAVHKYRMNHPELFGGD